MPLIKNDIHCVHVTPLKGDTLRCRTLCSIDEAAAVNYIVSGPQLSYRWFLEDLTLVVTSQLSN